LRENQLKIIGGTIMRSQACMVGSKLRLRDNEARLAVVQQLLDLIEARYNGKSSYSLVANIAGPSVEHIGRLVTANPDLAGLQGPTISPVWNKHATTQDEPREQWFAINVVVPQKELLPAVTYLRSIGASTVTATPVQYTFYTQSRSFVQLLERLHT
jgi:ATP phosphoribosyltransferase